MPPFAVLRLLFGPRLFVWGAILTLAALVLCFVPLFNLLGFDFAFAIALVIAFAGADVGHGAVAAARRRGLQPEPLDAVGLGVAGALGLVVGPLVLSLLNALRIRNCDLGVGFQFYLLLPVASALVAAPSGALCGLLLPRRGRILAFAVPFASIAWSLLRLYRDPAVFVLDPFGGFFPGPIYDEALRPSTTLLFFRLANLLWMATAVLAVGWLVTLRAALRSGARPLPRARLLAQAALAAPFLAASITVWLFRFELAFHTDHGRLHQVLSRETRSAHFRVRSDPRYDGEPHERALLLEDLEFRYHQLSRTLGVEPAGPTTIYLFPSAEVKKGLVGAGGTLYAKPWAREIYLQADRFPAGHLRHELAHVFAGVFGDPLFGISLDWRLPFPRLASGLIEGVAVAADFGDPRGEATVHQQARAMLEANLAPPLDQVVGAGFSTLSGARAYTLAGSFCHFLLGRHGPEKLRAVYRGAGNFEKVYGQPLAALERDWQKYVRAQPLDQDSEEQAKERFRRPAIFKKVCAREIGARVEEANQRLYREPEAAVELFASVCDDEPQEPTHTLSLAHARFVAGQVEPARAAARKLLEDENLTRTLRARAANLLVLIAYHGGDFGEASQALDRHAELATDEATQRTIFARQRALQDLGARQTLGRVLFGDSPSRGVDGALVMYLLLRFEQAFPDEALGPYLVGRQLAYRDPALAASALDRACPPMGPVPAPVPLTPRFRQECLELLAIAAFEAGNLDRSRAAMEAVKASAKKQAARLRAEDFLERIAFSRSKKVDSGSTRGPS